MDYESWGCIIIMTIVSVGLFYILMSAALHPHANFGFYFITVGNLMYISAFLLAIVGVVLYLYTFKRANGGTDDNNGKVMSIFYMFTFIGIILISWLCFNFQLNTKSIIGIFLVIFGLILFAIS